VQVGTSRDSSVSGGADYPFTLTHLVRGRRLITTVDFAEAMDRDLTSRRTISRYGVKPFGRLPTGLPSRCYDTLYVAYEEGFPVISRYAGVLCRLGQSSYPTRNFARSLTRRRSRRADGTPWMPSLHVAMQTGPSHHPVSRVFGVWPLRILISSGLGFRLFIV
jgi:hypothetical protein